MPKRKQGEVDNEGVQDFELIELLIRETGAASSTSTQQGGDFESFKARFQSYVDQIPSYLHSVGKEGFFPHFFLGSFSTLVDTEIATKLNIEKIYFSFDSSKTLKVAVIKKGEIKSPEDVADKVKLFVIAESGSTRKKFSYGELDKILGNTKVARNNVVRLARDQGKLGVRLVENTKEKDAKGKMAGISVNVESNKLDNDASTTHEFKEIKKGLWSNPENDIEKLTNSNAGKVKESVEEVLKKVGKIHSKYKDSLVYANQAREAAHHGFIAGALMNFRYRYNLRVYLEQFAGRGYADIILVPRGKDRSLNAIPIIIELKAATAKELEELKKEGKVKDGSQTTPAIALEQAKDYAKGFQPNVMRVLTTANDILCVGVNPDHPSPISDIAVKSRDQKVTPLLNDILGSIDERSNGKINEGKLREQIQNNIERIYHTFPGTGEKGDNHYFSRFLLGQSLLFNEALETNFEKHVFIYRENIPTEAHPEPKSQRLKDQKSKGQGATQPSKLGQRHGVVTIVLIPKNAQKSVCVMNIVETDGRANVMNKGIPLDRLQQEIGNRKIVELNLNFNIKKKSKFEEYFSVEVGGSVSLEQYNSRETNKFEGNFKDIPYPAELKGTFDKTLESQLASSQDQSQSIDKYKELFGKLGEAMLPFKFLIEKEAHTQAVFHGAFSHYSDIKLGESQENRALVLTEFQTGRGKRIDMVVHGIKFADQASSAKEYDPVGLELKGPREGKKADALKDEANKQIADEYKKGVTYKTLTDGTEVAFMGVVFDKDANNADSLILMSKDEFASVKVVHSSIFSFSQQQCSKGRRTRSIGMPCIDSFDEEEITEEEKEQRIKELFNADKVAERVKNIEFYDQLFKVSQQISKGEIIDKNVEEAFAAKIKDVDLDSIDSEIRDIVKEMRDNIENKEEVKNILRRSGVAEKIGKVAEGAGLAFTVFLVGKHIANGDIEGLGYDALNLWVMPKIGEKISGKMLELGTKLDSQMLKGFAPVMGRAIGNFAAFLGLAESIKARQNATDPVDIKIADLNIATNSIFIAADVPAVVTETMSAIGMEAGIIGEFAGPVGAAVSVAVIIISQFVEAELEVEKLEEHIKLTDQEKHDLYWDFFFGKKVPDYIEHDVEAKEIYEQYISNVINKFRDGYDRIAMTLPTILESKRTYSACNLRRVGNKITPGGYYENECKYGLESYNMTLDSSIQTHIKYPLQLGGTVSRLVPIIDEYNVICGPISNDISDEVYNQETKSEEHSANYHRTVTTTKTKFFFKNFPSTCSNIIIYEKKSSRGYEHMYYITSQNTFIDVTSNYTIDVIFNGKNILLNSYGINNQGSGIKNRYYFTNQLSNCDIHKQGTNFFYIVKDNFVCNLGGSSIGQNNIVVTRGNFTDSENIHSIIGSDKANHIEVSHAGYVDSKGGNDVITAKNFTTIKGYFGDSIHGSCLVLLPINFSDIGNIAHANNITNIYNKSGAFISVDKQTLVKTADGLFVIPTKVDTNTGRVTNLQVTKSMDSDVILDDELDNLRKIDNSSFNITKQLSSANYHSTIGSSSNHIFYPDKENHNFYWEAPGNISHLYLFDNRNANITIAQANGILDFSQLNSTLNDMPFIENNEGEIKINKNDLYVTLLPDYKDVTVTFDGEEYYKFQNGELERDYCSHSLKIDGRFNVNGTDLLNHHNCFTFDSDKVLFLKLNNDLLLLSDKGALSISDYYSSVHKNWDLSIGLNNRIMEPEEFGERADDFSSFRYYKPDEQGLQIYHNQPINKNDIGLVDFKDKSVLDFDMKVINDTLLLLHKNNTLVKVENWDTYQPAREMMFAFNDTMVSNAECIASTCNSEDVIVELNKEKAVLSTEQLFNAVRQNNLSEVDNLLSMGADVNIRDKHNWTPLHYAANNNNKLDISRAILNRNADIEARTNIGETPLHIANAYGQLKIIEFLIDKGANIEAKTNDGLTPLHVAIQHNNTTPKIVEFLLDKGVNIEARTKDDWTPLHYAVSKSRFDIVRVLLSRGADIEAKDKDEKTPLDLADIEVKDDNGNTPVLLAVQEGNFDMLKLLLDKNANIEARGDDDKTPLHLAIETGNLNMVRLLLDRGASIETKRNSITPLHYAAQEGKLNIFKLLLDNHANINVRGIHGKTTLHFAAQGGNIAIVKLLLDMRSKSTKVDVKDYAQRTPLYFAVQSGNLDAANLLLDRGANINDQNIFSKETLLHAAVKSNKPEVIKVFLDRGISIESKDIDGKTPMLLAAQLGNLDAVRLLLDNRANIEAQDNNGWTSMLYAAQGSKWDMVKFLIAQGAKFNNEITYQGTPLHFAAQEGNSNMVQFLLDKGANIEAQDAYNRKPLHIAVDANRLNVVNLLLDRGADVNALTADGRTPYDLAINQNYREVKEYLRSKSAVPSSMLIPDDSVRQRKRRHHHGDHSRNHNHSSHKFLSVDSSNQPEVAASSGTRTSSSINDLFGSVKNFIGELFYSKAELPTGTSNTTNSISQVDVPIDVNGTIMLLDVLVRKVTGQKYISTADQSIFPLEAQGYALNITTEFEQVLKDSAIKSGISVTNLSFNPVKMQSTIVGQVRNGSFSKISKILYSSAKEACPEFKQRGKFLAHLRSHLEEVLVEKRTIRLQQKVEQVSKASDQPTSSVSRSEILKKLQDIKKILEKSIQDKSAIKSPLYSNIVEDIRENIELIGKNHNQEEEVQKNLRGIHKSCIAIYELIQIDCWDSLKHSLGNKKSALSNKYNLKVAYTNLNIVVKILKLFYGGGLCRTVINSDENISLNDIISLQEKMEKKLKEMQQQQPTQSAANQKDVAKELYTTVKQENTLKSIYDFVLPNRNNIEDNSNLIGPASRLNNVSITGNITQVRNV